MGRKLTYFGTRDARRVSPLSAKVTVITHPREKRAWTRLVVAPRARMTAASIHKRSLQRAAPSAPVSIEKRRATYADQACAQYAGGQRIRCHVRVAPFAPSDGPEVDDGQSGVTVTTDLDGTRHLDLPVVPGSAAKGGEQRKALLCATRYDSLYDGSDHDDTVVEEVAVPLLEAVQAGRRRHFRLRANGHGEDVQCLEHYPATSR